MIRTQIVEVSANGDETVETTLGYTTLPEVPIEKKAPVAAKDGETPPQPLVIRVNGDGFWIVGHSWDVSTSADLNAVAAATLVLIVQRIPVKSSIIQPTPKPTLVITAPGVEV